MSLLLRRRSFGLKLPRIFYTLTDTDSDGTVDFLQISTEPINATSTGCDALIERYGVTVP